MWMSTSKQVLHPPINGTTDEHFRLESFSDPRLPDDKGAGLDKRDPQVKCEQRGVWALEWLMKLPITPG